FPVLIEISSSITSGQGTAYQTAPTACILCLSVSELDDSESGNNTHRTLFAGSWERDRRQGSESKDPHALHSPTLHAATTHLPGPDSHSIQWPSRSSNPESPLRIRPLAKPAKTLSKGRENRGIPT